MKSRGVWDEVERLIAMGQIPAIKLTPGLERKLPPGPRGRPRFRDSQNPYRHYTTPTLGYIRPLCLVCRKRLRKYDVEVCSESCRVKAESYLTMKLNALKRCVVVPITNSTAQYLIEKKIARVA